MMRTFDSCTVDDIKVVEARGPWVTKSGGELNVSFALGASELAAFLDVENPEFASCLLYTSTLPTILRV